MPKVVAVAATTTSNGFRDEAIANTKTNALPRTRNANVLKIQKNKKNAHFFCTVLLYNNGIASGNDAGNPVP